MWKVTTTNAPGVLVGASAALSCILGGVTAHLITKKVMTAKYETLIAEEVDAARLYFSKLYKSGDYSEPKRAAESLRDKTPDVEQYEKMAEVYSRAEGVPIHKVSGNTKVKPEEGEDMETFEKRLIQKAKEEVEDVKERLGIFEEDEDESEEEVITMNVFSDNSSEADERNPNKPFILTQREFEEGEYDYAQNTLTYFEGDDVLTDDRDQPIHNKRPVVGDDNLQFGEKSNDPNVVYIRNNHLEVDFEVCRSAGSFAEEVLGYTEPSNKQRPRKFREYD